MIRVLAVCVAISFSLALLCSCELLLTAEEKAKINEMISSMREEAKALSTSYSMPDYSTPDIELSVPDDWKKPVEDNYNSMPQSEYKPDFPEYVPGEGDTGETGEDWELPNFNLDGDGVTGSFEDYKELIPNGEYGLSDLPSVEN